VSVILLVPRRMASLTSLDVMLLSIEELGAWRLRAVIPAGGE